MVCPRTGNAFSLLGAKGLGSASLSARRPLSTGVNTRICSIMPGPTCLDALDDLPDAELFSMRSAKTDETRFSELDGTFPIWPGRCAAKLPKHGQRYQRKLNPEVLTSSYRTEHSSIHARRASRNTEPGTVGRFSAPFSSFPPDGVSNTLRAGTRWAARGAFTQSHGPSNYKHQPLRYGSRNWRGLHGFPDWFRFNQPNGHGWPGRLENAVPPTLCASRGLGGVEGNGSLSRAAP